MAAKITDLTTPAQLSTLLSKNSVVVLDFHATWCGPCKTIAPVFSALASKHTSPGKVAFAKVDVDAAQAIAQQYTVTAMPTFLVFTNGRETARIRGADAGGLTSAVTAAAKSAKPAVGQGVKLGGAPSTPKPVFVRNGTLAATAPLGNRIGGLVDTIIRFVVLYVVSLFSIDGIKAAEESRFSVRGGGGSGGGGGGGGGPGGRKLGSMDTVKRTNASCSGGSCG